MSIAEIDRKQSEHEPDPDAHGGSPVIPGERRVGVEVEFGGLSASEAARIIRGYIGGTIDARDAHCFTVSDTRLGDIKVELDSKYVHGPDNASELERNIREMAGYLSDPVVPTELITDPIPVSRIAEVDDLVRHLSAAGAVGTEQLHLACGLHLNIEHKAGDVSSILSLLRAFLLRVETLRNEIAPDRVRTMLPFIGRFPEDYVALVLDPDYEPDLATFIRDYCASNPSKNRELDLLPLLASLDAETVEEALGKPQDAVRPAFHYRLPNARLADSNWSILNEWQRWMSVEALAGDERALAAAMDEWNRRHGGSAGGDLLDKIISRIGFQ